MYLNNIELDEQCLATVLIEDLSAVLDPFS